MPRRAEAHGVDRVTNLQLPLLRTIGSQYGGSFKENTREVYEIQEITEHGANSSFVALYGSGETLIACKILPQGVGTNSTQAKPDSQNLLVGDLWVGLIPNVSVW